MRRFENKILQQSISNLWDDYIRPYSYLDEIVGSGFTSQYYVMKRKIHRKEGFTYEQIAKECLEGITEMLENHSMKPLILFRHNYYAGVKEKDRYFTANFAGTPEREMFWGDVHAEFRLLVAREIPLDPYPIHYYDVRYGGEV